MVRFTQWLIATAVVFSTMIGAVQASDCYCPPTYVVKKVTVYETVICHETQCVAYKVCVTRYDRCGRPYSVQETRYREVQVPVKKVVASTRYVKVLLD